MSDEINRDPSGKFLKGRSGNPGGRAKNEQDLVRLARSYTKLAVDTLVGICRDKAQPTGSRVAAARELLDRAWGRPAHSSFDLVQQAGPVRSTITVEFVRAKDGRPWPNDLPADLDNVVPLPLKRPA